jgi:GntR family transcriptional repressor for pyruvate dehydrogenase complex
MASDDLLGRIVAIAVELSPDPDGRIRLPPERELAELLGVQRMTLRERLTVLQTMGFVQRTQGSGTYLALPNSRFLQFYFEVALSLGFVTIDQIQGALEMFGCEIASNAALNAEIADFDDLELIGNVIVSAGRVDAVIDSQLQFHTVLARATRNPVIVILMNGIASVIREVLGRRAAMIAPVRGSFGRIGQVYLNVVQTMRDREPDAARSAMHECYAMWRREAAKIATLIDFEAADGVTD